MATGDAAARKETSSKTSSEETGLCLHALAVGPRIAGGMDGRFGSFHRVVLCDVMKCDCGSAVALLSVQFAFNSP